MLTFLELDCKEQGLQWDFQTIASSPVDFGSHDFCKCFVHVSHKKMLTFVELDCKEQGNFGISVCTDGHCMYTRKMVPIMGGASASFSSMLKLKRIGNE